MDATHIHLILTHFPIVGTIIGIAILIFGQFTDNKTIKKTAFITIIMMAILTIPVYLSGEEAEDTVENIAGISENIIEEHEELAEVAIWFMGLLGLFSLISYFAVEKEFSFAKIISIITIVISIATFGIFAKLANSGGEIRHSEIRKVNNKDRSSDTYLNNHDNHDDD